jgi:sulfite reductase alpha subunit-like flavoprotein
VSYRHISSFFRNISCNAFPVPDNALSITYSTINISLYQESIFYFTDASLPKLPEPCSIKYLVENYLDINGVPRRSFFEMLLYFADEEREKEKLEEFTSSEGQVIVYAIISNSL